MAKKISLREFQESVASKLRDASDAALAASKLGLEIGPRFWLVDLVAVSEVIPVPALTTVPLTRPWLRGVASIRGNLYTIVDFSVFMGGEPTPASPESRLLLLHPRFKVNSGLLVDRMLGLRNPEQFRPKKEDAERAPWIAAAYTDAAGQSWYELDVGALVGSQSEFLQVGL